MQIQGTPQQKKFLAVLVPHMGEVSSEWAVSLKNLQCPDGSQVFFSRGMPIDVTRDQMVRDIIKDGFEWIFFLDSDVICQPNVITTLLAHNLPLVCGIYDAKKREGFYPAMWVRTKLEDGKEAFGAIQGWQGRMIKVDVIGCGCMLVHRSVFEKIREKTQLPFFLWTKERNREIMPKDLPDPLMYDVSEDFFFCLLAKYFGGIDIVVDTEVKCGHISTCKLEGGKAGIPGV
jgi:hypothetical protein